MYKKHTHCRACGYAQPSGPDYIKSSPPGEKLISVFSLGVQPLANDFKKAGEEHAGFAPLDVLLCPRCNLAQLSVVVNPEILYSRYAYVTSPSQTMKDHWLSLLDALKRPTHGNILEIGSNDGAFMAWLAGHGASVIGIDPAENLAGIANANNLRTIVGKLDEKTAAKALAVMGSFDIIFARHVFCHIDDWHAAIRAIESVSNRDTSIVIEAPYVMDTLGKVEFDQIYCEHLSFMSLRAMEFALEGSSLFLQDAFNMPIHGGAVVLVIRSRECGLDQTDRVKTMLENEKCDAQAWHDFSSKATALIRDLRERVKHIIECENATVCGYGASAKSTVWVNACGFTRNEIKFITDTTVSKQWTCSPGTDIPIVDPGALLREMPQYAIIFCWNFATEVLRKEKIYRDKGGKFIIPIPSVEVV